MTGEDIYIILGHELSDFKVALASRQSGWDWAEYDNGFGLMGIAMWSNSSRCCS